MIVILSGSEEPALSEVEWDLATAYPLRTGANLPFSAQMLHSVQHDNAQIS